MSADASRSDPAVCPFEVPRPVMLQGWAQLTFLHWPFDPEAVQRRLPRDLEVEAFDGVAWVGLVPFLMTVAVPGVPALPWLSRFCETNVRTYVRNPATGRTGIWFFSLDAARLAAVVAARWTYRLPYAWSRMTLQGDGTVVRYRSRRRWPGPRGARCDVTVRVGEPLPPQEMTALDHFLTARWVLFSVTPRRSRLARAWHVPWPLHRAEAVAVSDGLVAAAGLPAPDGDPLVRYSPGVDVRIGRPERTSAVPAETER